MGSSVVSTAVSRLENTGSLRRLQFCYREYDRVGISLAESRIGLGLGASAGHRSLLAAGTFVGRIETKDNAIVLAVVLVALGGGDFLHLGHDLAAEFVGQRGEPVDAA